MIRRPERLAAARERAGQRAAEIGESYGSFASGIRLSIERLRDLAKEIDTVQGHRYSQVTTQRIISLDYTMFRRHGAD